MTDKPLHVRVAEALGWRDLTLWLPSKDLWTGRHPLGMEAEVPHYDTSWEATGPLIEKYGIALVREEMFGKTWWEAYAGLHLGCDGAEWSMRADGECDTALQAVCNLILSLAEAGRLPK